MSRISFDPAEGIHMDVSHETYHDLWRALNHSKLEWLDRGPRYFVHRMTQPHEETPQMRLGTAAHTAILEPARFVRQYNPMPDFGDMRSPKNRAARDAWIAEHPDVKVLPAEEYEAAQRMAEAVQSHPLARDFIGALTEIEPSVVWIDPVTGIRCKARPDGIIGPACIMLDLKTCRDSRPEQFERAFHELGYWRQFPFYGMGLAVHQRGIERVAVVAVENEPPHDVRVYEVMQSCLELGHHDCRRLLNQYARFEEHGWPTHTDEILLSLSLPAWAYSRIASKTT